MHFLEFWKEIGSYGGLFYEQWVVTNPRKTISVILLNYRKIFFLSKNEFYLKMSEIIFLSFFLLG